MIYDIEYSNARSHSEFMAIKADNIEQAKEKFKEYTKNRFKKANIINIRIS